MKRKRKSMEKALKQGGFIKNHPIFFKAKEIDYCGECEGDGYIQMSCCGDDMKGRWEENDCCPSCYEHCGEPEHETCDECDGTGKEEG